MDRELAVKLYNLLNNGKPVGVDNEGGVVYDGTDLGLALHLLEKPTAVSRSRIKDDTKAIERITPNGVTYKDFYEWQTKPVAAWLREWADAMDPPAQATGGRNDYRKKPVVVQAVQLRWDTWQEMCEHAGVGNLSEGKPEGFWPDGIGTGRIGMRIPTLEGLMEAVENDWVIKGVLGEIYPCKPDIFEATYEKVSP